MNERIRELAKQALKQPDTDNDGLTVFDNDELEKFAELIVKECCNFNYDFLESYREACEVNSKIREHFGVEE
jgi:hypothetical protein